MLHDTDADGLVDVIEEALGTDPRRPDSNFDGVGDGLAAWAQPLTTGKSDRVNLAPKFLFPGENALIPSASRGQWPLRIQLKPVFGATGYVLQLRGVEGETLSRQIRHLEERDVVLGAWVSTVLDVPPDLRSGRYTLHVQGFRSHPRDLIGSVATQTIRIVSSESDTVTLHGEHTLQGAILAESITIAAGAIIRVPAGETLELIALTELTVEDGAAIIGENGPRGGSIGLTATRGVRIDGVVLGGHGQDAVDRVEEGVPLRDAIVRGEAGGQGGHVWAVTRGELVVSEAGRLHAGDGGDGGGAFALGADAIGEHGLFEAVQANCMQPDAQAFEACAQDCEESEFIDACQAQCEGACLEGVFDVDGRRAWAEGGRGGAGGTLGTWASAMHVARVPGILRTGVGGRGGAAEARSGRPGLHGARGAASSAAGAGGPSGDLMVHQPDLDGDGTPNIGGPDDPIGGGIAGPPGTARALSEHGSNTAQPISTTTCGCPAWGRDGQDEPDRTGAAGGAGWITPGGGAPVIVIAGGGTGCGRGGHAVATGGIGGKLRRITVPFGVGIINELNYSISRIGSRAARGGNASVYGGRGGAHGVGQGGNATATGGQGGSAAVALGGSAQLAGGGHGGDAYARGGKAGNGYDCCTPQAGQGGNGGQSGQSVATGGAGGEAAHASGNGGNAVTESFDGGQGGKGSPTGKGGVVGSSVAKGGAPGKSVSGVGVGNRGKSKEGTAIAGANGAACPATR